jgi:hypothetical protein
MAGKNCIVEIALITANSSCLSMVLRQELLYTTQNTGLTIRQAGSRVNRFHRSGSNQPPLSL